MRRAVTAPPQLAAVAALAAACLTISAAPALAASSQPARTAAAHAQTAALVTASHPADGRIAFTDFKTNQIYTVNPDGSALAQLTREPKGIAARWADWSPSGSRILFDRFNLSNNVGRIWIMNADGTGQRQLVSDRPGNSDNEPSYSPDGRQIVFTRCLANFEHCAIWIMRSDGTHRRLVIPFIPAPNETSNFGPDVSPDGRHITFARFGFKGVISQVWVANIDGTHARPLTAPGLEAFGPSWSPDGSHIAFASNSNRVQSGIYVMRSDGTGVTRLALPKWPNNNFLPAYAPDGSQIAFSSDRRYPDLCCADLFVMRANGSQQHLVATGLQGVIDVAWGTAALVRAGSPGTLSRPLSSTPAPRAARDARCGEAAAWLTSRQCGLSSAGIGPHR